MKHKQVELNGAKHKQAELNGAKHKQAELGKISNHSSLIILHMQLIN